MNKISIIFEDNNLIVLNKPPYLEMEQIYQWLKIGGNNLDRGGAAHRLDRDTSGVLLVGKNEKTLKNLQDQFRDRIIKKEYLALVHNFVEEEFTVDEALVRNPKEHLKFTVDESGKPSSTKFTPLKKYKLKNPGIYDFDKRLKNQLKKMNYGEFTLLLASPQTGRTHQIRVHLNYAHFPLVGDEKYGGRKTSKLDLVWCERQFLHAKKIGFLNPDNGQLLEFEAELPTDLQKALKNLAEV